MNTVMHRPQGVGAVIRRHAEEAATRWWRRDTAYLDDPRTLFSTLADFDETIDAHLDGLCLAGEAGRAAVARQLATDAPDSGADCFAALALAYSADDTRLVADMAALTEDLPGAAWALEGVFAWFDTARAAAAVQAHLAAGDTRQRAAALAQCHTHRLGGGAALAACLRGTTPELVARAVRTAGECGRRDLLPAVSAYLDDADPALRYWAAWSATLLGGFNESVFAALDASVRQGGEHQAEALRLIALAAPRARVRDYLQGLLATAPAPRPAILALGWSGDPAHVPALLALMRAPAHAVEAAEAFRLITGFDCERDDASAEPPFDPDGEDGQQDEAYPYPDASQVAAWWQDRQAQFDPATRYVLGAPISLAALAAVLDTGEQAHRELAALHWVLMRPGTILLPLRAHSAIQWLRLQQLLEQEWEHTCTRK